MIYKIGWMCRYETRPAISELQFYVVSDLKLALPDCPVIGADVHHHVLRSLLTWAAVERRSITTIFMDNLKMRRSVLMDFMENRLAYTHTDGCHQEFCDLSFNQKFIILIDNV